MIPRTRKNRIFSGDQYFAREINPDEIFLDSKNLPGFDKDQFEGRIETPIGIGSLMGVGIAFLSIIMIFLGKSFSLQVIHGAEYLSKSENNRLDHTPIFATRGVIYDRNGEKLAWNTFNEASNTEASSTPKIVFPHRSYIQSPGFGHLLGYVSYPKQDSKGFYYQEALVGKDGLEEEYNDLLSGVNGLQISETDAHGVTTMTGSIVEDAQDGASLTLSIDARIQEKLAEFIGSVAGNIGYMAGAGVIMDITTGELLALTSFPDYNSEILSEGTNKKVIQDYQSDSRKVFLDRAVSGIYTPGSTVKPMLAIAALNEGVVTPETKILSTGSISIPNPYNPKLKTVFNDWKAHGWVDVRDAIAVSSDVYFYEVGGGFQNQKGIGIANIEKYSRMFGYGAPTGIDLAGEKSGTIPSPEWKEKVFPGDPWRIGNTYHTSIGQYGFQVSILQSVRAIAAIASSGTLVTPHLLKDPSREHTTSHIDIPEQHFQVAREGMRQAVTVGGVKGLNVEYMEVAGKTGTAEIDAGKKYINSWVVGFFPYEKPKYAFAVVMERGPYDTIIGAVYVVRQILDWMHINTPEYLE